MKTYIALALSIFGLFSTQTKGNDCLYKEMTTLKRVYVLPLYQASVTYFFNKKEKEAFAQISWSLDQEKTKQCFTLGKETYPLSNLKIPTVRMEDLAVKVSGSLTTTPLIVYEESTGHWNGQADLLKIPYSKKAEIEKAIKNGERIIEIVGNFHYRMSITERKIVGEISCTKKTEEAGVLNLLKRLSEIKAELEKRNASEEVNLEEVMGDFLGTCVEFHTVDSNSLVEFESKQRLSSKIIKGQLSYKGNVSRETTETLPTVSIQNASVLEI